MRLCLLFELVITLSWTDFPKLGFLTFQKIQQQKVLLLSSLWYRNPCLFLTCILISLHAISDNAGDFFFCLAEKPSAQSHSLCGSSKLPLYRPSSIATASCDQLDSTKRKLPSYDLGSSSQQASCKRLFKNSTANSPIRKFVLVNSDSDDPSTTEHPDREEAMKTDIPTKRKTEASYNEPGNEDLWKNFHQVKSFHVPTPAFDEVCDEYFLSIKDTLSKNQKPPTCSSPGDDVICLQPRVYKKTSQNPLPPSHQYFFHNDLRIQNLVRSRLPYFFPIGGGNNEELRHPNTSTIDYMYI